MNGDIKINRSKFFHYLERFRVCSGVLPFVALIFVSFSVQDFGDSSDILFYKGLLIVLTLVGVLGFLSSTKTIDRLRNVRF